MIKANDAIHEDSGTFSIRSATVDMSINLSHAALSGMSAPVPGSPLAERRHTHSAQRRIPPERSGGGNVRLSGSRLYWRSAAADGYEATTSLT
jgi:hypothetical protein